MNYVGIDWAYGRAAFCAMGEGGEIASEGLIPANEDGLARLVLEQGTGVRAAVEMMSGAVWVRDRLEAAGWEVQVAHARKVRDVAPLACKTDRVDARVLAELCRRDLVPELWLPSLGSMDMTCPSRPIDDQGEPVQGEPHPDHGARPRGQVVSEVRDDRTYGEGDRQRAQPGSPPGQLGAFAGQACARARQAGACARVVGLDP